MAAHHEADQRDAEMLATRAEAIMRAHLGRPVCLRGPALIARRQRSLVVRCAVTGWDAVTSVVVKQNLGDDARGFTEWASLAFLSALDQAAGVAPRFYAGAVEHRLLVMEDLGGSRSLEDVLAGGDRATVVSVLQELAATMARLVTATAHRDEDFDRRRAGLPGATGLGRRQEATRWLAARDRVAQWAAALAIDVPRGFDAACEHVAAVYAEPGPYLAFSHGDPAPSNSHVAPHRVRLVDFEYAANRHALYDLTAWSVLCPLPLEWFAAIERTFRRAVTASPLAASPLGAALAEDRPYEEARATMCAYRALAMTTWLSPDILVQDREWVPGWSQRQALISTALRLRQTTAGIAGLAPVSDLGGAMAARLQARWPELGDGALRWPGDVE
jgi:hypothetical protein